MDWKKIAIKVGKGALTAGGAAIGVMLKTGIPINQHAWVLAAYAVGGAVFHGAWNVIEQVLEQ